MEQPELSQPTSVSKEELIEAAVENLPPSYRDEGQALLDKAITQESVSAYDLPRIAEQVAPKGTDDDLLFALSDSLQDLSNPDKSDLFTAQDTQELSTPASVDKESFIDAAVENLSPNDQSEAREILDKAIAQESVSADDLPQIAEQVAPRGTDDDLRFEIADNVQDLGNPDKSDLFTEKTTDLQQLDSEIADVMASVTTQVNIAEDTSISQSNAISDEALQRSDSDEINR